MFDRRQHPRYILVPPLAGRALVDDIGQVEAELLDASAEGARLSLIIDGAGQSLLLSGTERSIAATIGRPSGNPWKFVLVHSRMTTIAAAATGGSRCVVGGRFVVAPTFGVADLDAMLVSKTACRVVQRGAVLLLEGAANLAMLQSHVAPAAKTDIACIDLSALHLLERDAMRAWIAEAANKYPALEFIQPKA